MTQRCNYCGRVFESERRQKYCNDWCKEAERLYKEPCCPYYVKERYGQQGGIYCKGARLKQSDTKKRAIYKANHCRHFDGGGCTIKAMIEGSH